MSDDVAAVVVDVKPVAVTTDVKAHDDWSRRFGKTVQPRAKRREMKTAAKKYAILRHIVKLTRADTSMVSEDMKEGIDYVRNSQGEVMVVERFPCCPRAQTPSLGCPPFRENMNEFGCPVAVNLYFKFLREGALVFLLMFLLSAGAMYDNNERSWYRQQCRAQAFGNDFASADDGAEANECGWDGVAVRDFGAEELEHYQYDSPAWYYFLRTSLGACSEYSNRTYPLYGSNQSLIENLPLMPRGGATAEMMVRTPLAAYCLGGIAVTSLLSQWLQLLGLLLFLLWLVRLRWLTQTMAKLDDECRFTTADYSVMLTGLADGEGVNVDELQAELEQGLEKIRREQGFEGNVVDVVLGVECHKELDVVGQLRRLDLQAAELDAHRRVRLAAGKSTAAVDRRLKALVPK